MGSTCSSVKKSSSKDAKSNERKESAESIPYGQTSSECPSSVTGVGAVGASSSSGKGAKPSVELTEPSGTTATQARTTASSAQSVEPSHTQLGATLSSSSTTGSQVPPSLSPVPTASSPSPYSTPYCGGNGANPAAAYQNISPTKGHLSLSQYSESVRAASFTQLFHTRSGLTTTSSTESTADGEDALGLEDFYVIAVSTESDEVVVWSVYEQKAVRTMRSIPRPRDVRMVDQLRAVVLCNRELMLYDLDQAALVTKLKGVMNHKMPYYGLHSERYVVALSRNRMYVNMINLNTGDLETTFKAGEDRFLNSLLTSANGKICVCGDETQKPFPLLVWDLSNRKLLYDLRIPHHEFLTRLSAISDDGHYVVSVCQECNSSSTNFLIVYDLQSGTLFKKWKPECDSVSVAISTRCAGCVINGIENNDVLVWDLSTGNIKYTLSGHTAPPDLLQAAEKANVFLSYNSNRQDPQLRIWSLEQGVCLWTFTPRKELSCCCLTPNGLAIVHGFVGEKSLQLVVREDADKSAQENESFTRAYLEEMRSKVVSYGDGDLLGRVTDLKSS